MLTALWSLPTLGTPEAADAVMSFRRSVGQQTRRTDEELKGLRSEIAATTQTIVEQRSEIDSQKGRLDQAIADYQQQFSTAESQRAATFNQTVAQAQQDLRNAIDALDGEVSEARDRALEHVSKTEQATQAELAKVRSNLQSELQQVQGLRDEAANLVDIIGNTGLTGNYQRIANREDVAADTWRWIALVSLVITGLGNAALLIVELVRSIDLATLIGSRISVTVPLLALSAWAIAESRQHRGRAQESRQMELQLASIEPYLAKFPPDDTRAIKRTMIDRFFPGHSSQSVLPSPTRDTPVEPGAV
jgi:hypothetical protein